MIGGASVEEYQKDLIKKHEATITSREQMFISYLDKVEYNAEPVLLCHEPSAELDKILDRLVKERPEYEFTTTDCITHELWCVCDTDVQKIETIFESIPATYIADGHHRSASSSGLHDLRIENGVKYPNQEYFLSYFIDETKLKIFEYNRLVRNTTGKSSAQLLEEMSSKFEISPLSGAKNPENEHQISMCLEDKWYRLSCKPEIIDHDHPVNCLDAEILTQHVLSPILNIHDLKTDENIDFISGVESLANTKKRMKKGGFDILFALYPVTMDQVKKVADNQMIMPPKSTWVEPKMRSGLTIYPINE